MVSNNDGDIFMYVFGLSLFIIDLFYHFIRFSGSVVELWDVQPDQLATIQNLETNLKVGMPRSIGQHLR